MARREADILPPDNPQPHWGLYNCNDRAHLGCHELGALETGVRHKLEILAVFPTRTFPLTASRSTLNYSVKVFFPGQRETQLNISSDGEDVTLQGLWSMSYRSTAVSIREEGLGARTTVKGLYRTLLQLPFASLNRDQHLAAEHLGDSQYLRFLSDLSASYDIRMIAHVQQAIYKRRWWWPSRKIEKAIIILWQPQRGNPTRAASAIISINRINSQGHHSWVTGRGMRCYSFLTLSICLLPP